MLKNITFAFAERLKHSLEVVKATQSTSTAANGASCKARMSFVLIVVRKDILSTTILV